jgi:hypothetical protein
VKSLFVLTCIDVTDAALLEKCIELEQFVVGRSLLQVFHPFGGILESLTNGNDKQVFLMTTLACFFFFFFFFFVRIVHYVIKPRLESK